MATAERERGSPPTGFTAALTLDEQGPTEREIEALQLYIELGSIKRVAHQMRLTEQEIKRKMQSIRSKVGATTTAEAVHLLHDRLVTRPKDG